MEKIMTAMARFDSHIFGQAERVEKWAQFMKCDSNTSTTELRGLGPFAGSIVMAALGEVRLLKLKATPHRFERMPNAMSSDDVVKITIQTEGRTLLHQSGHELLLEPGTWAVCSADRHHSTTHLTDVEAYCLLLPRRWLGIDGLELVRRGRRRIGDRDGIGSLVPTHVTRLFEQIEAIPCPLHSDVADMLAHIVQLALAEERHVDGRVSMGETLRMRVESYVRLHLRDPDLSIERIADRFNCSKRYLHKIFSESSTTLNHFLWNERLERCREALDNPKLGDQSVSEIAYSWGFNNSAHFNKVFKNRFGAPPGEWRVLRQEIKGESGFYRSKATELQIAS
jgi:AraC-like DNA-binding protein